MSRLKSPVALAALVSLGLSLFLYSRSLALPFYSDDLLQFPWIKATPLLDFWRDVGPYDDYQPVHFMIWRLLYLSLGDLRPGLARCFNIAGHALCGALAGALVNSQKKETWVSAPLTSALFVAFPFAFDVVPWASAFCYPLTIALALGGVLCYLRARRQGSLTVHLLAVALTALSGFTYEGGVVAGPAILLVEATLVTKPRTWRWPAIHVAASALPLGLIVRFAPVSAHWLGGIHSLSNLLVALQCLAFPIAPLATLLGRVGIGPKLAMGCVGLCALLALIRIAYRTGWRRWFWFGLGWAVLWSVVPLANLRFNWERDPLRVLYPCAVGTAVIWGLPLARALGRRAGQRRILIPIVLTIGALVPSLLFVRERMALWQRSGHLLWQVLTAADDHDGPILFVNLPGRITPQTRLFPLGHEGVIPLPPPTSTDLLLRVHTGREDAAFERYSGAILPPLPYSVELAGAPLNDADLRAASEVFVLGRFATSSTCRDDEMRLEEAGAIVAKQPQIATPVVATFGQKIAVLSISCRRSSPTQVILDVDWRALGSMAGTPTVFAHLLGADGTPLAQADGEPLRGLYPFSRWRPGEVVHDVRVFDPVPSKPATVAIGIWEPDTGLRWKAVGSDGRELADDAFRCSVPAWQETESVVSRHESNTSLGLAALHSPVGRE